MFAEKNVHFFYFEYMRANDPGDVTNLDPRTTVSRVYIADTMPCNVQKYKL